MPRIGSVLPLQWGAAVRDSALVPKRGKGWQVPGSHTSRHCPRRLMPPSLWGLTHPPDMGLTHLQATAIGLGSIDRLHAEIFLRPFEGLERSKLNGRCSGKVERADLSAPP